jgi:uncharacterized membrane protein HdeD (DUF308 family)
MRSITPMRVAKIGYVCMSLALIVLGVLMMFYPGFSIDALTGVVGVCLILFGVVKLVGYFSKDLFRLAFQYDLAFGILMIALGIIVLVWPRNVVGLICVALGIAILADGLFKIQIAVDAKTFGIRLWWLIFALAILTGALGLVLVLRPTESSEMLTRLFGVALVAEGVLNLSTVLSSVKIVRHQRRDDVIDVDFRSY